MKKIELTAQQRAKKKYYEKIKNNPEFKAKVSAQKKLYYQNKKKRIFIRNCIIKNNIIKKSLEILVFKNL